MVGRQKSSYTPDFNVYKDKIEKKNVNQEAITKRNPSYIIINTY